MSKLLAAILLAAFLLTAQPVHATPLSDSSLGSPEHRINCAAPCWPIIWVTIRPE